MIPKTYSTSNHSGIGCSVDPLDARSLVRTLNQKGGGVTFWEWLVGWPAKNTWTWQHVFTTRFFFTIIHRQVLCLTYVNTWCAQQTHPHQVGEEKQRIKWFLCDNSTDAMNHPFGQRKRNIIRHPLNSRQQSSVRLAYVASCKARGVVEGVRGEAWLMQPSPSDSIQEKTPYLALS